MSAERLGLRALGRTGIQLLPLGLGAMNLGVTTTRATGLDMLRAAQDAGVALIDTADVYGAGASESLVGEFLREPGRRVRAVVATKVGFDLVLGPDAAPGAWSAAITAACESSLRRLGIDCIDLYQLHKPVLNAPPEEVVATFAALQRAGKIRHAGTTTHPAWLLMEGVALAAAIGAAGWATEQPAYNLLDRRVEREVLPWCRRYRVGVLPWGALGGGILAGRYAAGVDPASRAAAKPAVLARLTPAALAVADQLADIAGQLGLTAGQVALLWLRDRPGVTAPLIGPRSQAQLDEALATLSLSLSADVVLRLDALVPPGTALADFHNTVTWDGALTRRA